MRKLAIALAVTALGCAAPDVSAPVLEAPHSTRAATLDAEASWDGADAPNDLRAAPDPGERWDWFPSGGGGGGRTGGWGVLTGFGGGACGPAGQSTSTFPNPLYPSIPGITVTASRGCTGQEFPSDAQVTDWLRRMGEQRRRAIAESDWGYTNPTTTPAEETYCRDVRGNVPTEEEWADVVEWAEGVCPPCLARLAGIVLAGWGAVETAEAATQVGKDLIRGKTPCGEATVKLALASLGPIGKLGRAASSPEARAVLAKLMPGGKWIGKPFKESRFSKDLETPDGRKLFGELESLMGLTRRLSRDGQVWYIQRDGVKIVFREFSRSAEGMHVIDLYVEGTNIQRWKWWP